MFTIFWAGMNYTGLEQLSARDVSREVDDVKGKLSKANVRNELILKYSC